MWLATRSRRVTRPESDLLSLAEPPTAIFAANDVMAIGVMAAARDLGVRVPDQLTVVGFDDIAVSRYVNPTAHHRAHREGGADGARH